MKDWRKRAGRTRVLVRSGNSFFIPTSHVFPEKETMPEKKGIHSNKTGVFICLGILAVALPGAGCTGTFSGTNDTIPGTAVHPGNGVPTLPEAGTSGCQEEFSPDHPYPGSWMRRLRSVSSRTRTPISGRTRPTCSRQKPSSRKNLLTGGPSRLSWKGRECRSFRPGAIT